MSDTPATKDTKSPGACEVILGALAIAMTVNYAVALALGGYEFTVLGVSVRAHDLGKPFNIAVTLLVLRWIAGTRRRGLGSSLRGLVPWGVAGFAAAAALLLFMAFGRGARAGAFAAVYTTAGVVVAFSAAWLSWGEGYNRAARLVIFILAASLAAGTGDSLPKSALWAKTFHFESHMFELDAPVGADEAGLIFGGGQKARLEKRAVGADWRDAVAVEPGGFFTSEFNAPAGAVLSYSVSGGKGASATVTLVAGGTKKTIAEISGDALAVSAWNDLSVELDSAGPTVVEWAVEGGDAAEEMLFANPRLVITPLSAKNVILIVQDALRADRMSLYGAERKTSTEIDELAKSAVVFDDCVSNAPWTYPSMGTIFTSLQPTAHGLVSLAYGLSEDLDTLAETMREAGYYTAAIQANPIMAPEQGLAQGFNEYLHVGSLVTDVEDKARLSTAGILFDDALAWLEERDGGPYFLLLHLMDTHKPYAAVEGHDRFGAGDVDLYDGQIAYLSREFARFYKALEERGALADTTVILTADHGEQFMEHGYNGHGASLHTEEIEVPLVVWTPGAKPGRVAARVGLIDLAPTIVDVAGAEKMPAAEGRSLAAAFAGGEIEPRDVYSELVTFRPRGQYFLSITRGAHRFILANPDGGVAESMLLYDMTADPSENTSIVSTNEKLAGELKAELERFLARQKSLHEKLVPVDINAALSPERREQLVNLGYLQ